MKMKKILSFVLAFVLVASTINVGFAQGEVKTNKDKIDYLVEKGYVLGDAKGLRLNDSITREEFAVMLTKVLNQESAAKAAMNVPSAFKDMAADRWSNGFVNIASELKIIAGYSDGTFRPRKNVSYQEAIKMLAVAAGGTDIKPATEGEWAAPFISYAASKGLLNGLGELKYKDQATRENVFVMIYNYLDGVREADLSKLTAIVTKTNANSNLSEKQAEIVVLKSSLEGFKEGASYIVDLKDGMDAMDILGRVYDLDIDAKNVIKTYRASALAKTEIAPIAIKGARLYVGGDSKDSTVLEDKAALTEQKFRGAAVNGKYLDIFMDFAKETNYKADLAYVTSINAKVVYIKAFTFDDIMPVFEYANGAVKAIDDESGAIVKRNLKKAYLYDNGKLMPMDLSKLEKYDVLHFYAKDEAIALKNKIEGEGARYKLSKGGAYINLANKDYKLSDEKARRAVATVDEKIFTQVNAAKYNDEVKLLTNEKVNLALDIFGNVQVIYGKLSFDEDVFMIDRVTTNAVALIDRNGKEIRVQDSLDLRIYRDGKEIRLSELNNYDIVYAIYNKDAIQKIFVLNGLKDYDKAFKPLDKDGKNYKVYAPTKSVRRSSIYVAGKEVNLLDNTLLYNLVGVGKDYRVETITLDEVKNAGFDKTVTAYVFTVKDLKDKDVTKYDSFHGSDDAPVAIVFKNVEKKKVVDKEDIIELRSEYDAKIDRSFEGYDKTTTLRVYETDGEKFENCKAGDIVKLGLDKDGKVLRLDKLITDLSEEYTVLNVLYDAGGNEKLALKDSKGKELSVYTNDKRVVFGKNYAKDSVIKIALNENGEAAVISVIK
ncbi:S-layer homology domain-containing protein [uncultured Fenollaria sp.]|uniref:S-layer homology domain-containing protein n=1 Tax=uncultured Fenollaria sp. TaxID=1686315 RepID=UPI0025DAE659|nr:S-layer homology domain-containing protein [uncultured Fenollaria sp.]